VHWFTSVLPRLRKWIQERERKREVRLYNQRQAAAGLPVRTHTTFANNVTNFLEKYNIMHIFCLDTLLAT